MFEKQIQTVYRLWKRVLIAGLTALLVLLPAPHAMAASGDIWLAAAEALGVTAAYNACLHEILSIGNNAYYQTGMLKEDMKERGTDSNTHNIQLTDQVMKQLTEQGEYVLGVRSLPFRWSVNNNEEFNACCYPTNYISVNRGLVQELGGNQDEMAAVLGHEMTHGLREHSAHNYARAVAVYYGMSFLNMAAGAMDGSAMAALADYSIAKNVTLPTEYEADEGGFYLMTSAGFNPGGCAAAMAHMRYFEENQSSYYGSYDPYDHPDTDKREAKLMEMLTAYSCGHVTVRNREEVCIDGQPLVKARWTSQEYDNTPENAYFIAGGLAKAFHDMDSLDEWNFREDSSGRVVYLSDQRVYAVLKDFVATHHAEELLQELVTAAYASEPSTGVRLIQQKAEQERQAEQEKLREAVRNAEQKYVKMLRINGDAYNDMGLPQFGLREVNRAFNCVKQDNMAENYSIRGRSKAMLGNYEEGIADCNKAVEMDPKSPYNYLNRADAWWASGNRQAALQDCQQAMQLDKKIPAMYKMMAGLYDELGDKAHALEFYRSYKKLCREAEDIPEEYLNQIEPKKKNKAEKNPKEKSVQEPVKTEKPVSAKASVKN